MNIFDNIIKDTELIGISELLSQDLPGQLVQFYFTVYTHSNKINITSPNFSTAFKLAAKDAWLKKYLEIRAHIAEQIGELNAEK